MLAEKINTTAEIELLCAQLENAESRADQLVANCDLLSANKKAAQGLRAVLADYPRGTTDTMAAMTKVEVDLTSAIMLPMLRNSTSRWRSARSPRMRTSAPRADQKSSLPRPKCSAVSVHLSANA